MPEEWFVDVFVVGVPDLSDHLRMMLSEEIEDLVTAFLMDAEAGVLDGL